jgi:hypothetical protein
MGAILMLTIERTFSTIGLSCENYFKAKVKPRFSISTLLRLLNRLNLRDKNQKMFVNVERLRLSHIFWFFSHIFNLLITLATSPNGKSGLKVNLIKHSKRLP